jgi:hypothetical protein
VTKIKGIPFRTYEIEQAIVDALEALDALDAAGATGA